MPTYYTRDIIYEDKWAEDMRNSEAVFRRTFVGNQKMVTIMARWFHGMCCIRFQMG